MKLGQVEYVVRSSVVEAGGAVVDGTSLPSELVLPSCGAEVDPSDPVAPDDGLWAEDEVEAALSVEAVPLVEASCVGLVNTLDSVDSWMLDPSPDSVLDPVAASVVDVSSLSVEEPSPGTITDTEETVGLVAVEPVPSETLDVCSPSTEVEVDSDPAGSLFDAVLVPSGAFTEVESAGCEALPVFESWPVVLLESELLVLLSPSEFPGALVVLPGASVALGSVPLGILVVADSSPGATVVDSSPGATVVDPSPGRAVVDSSPGILIVDSLSGTPVVDLSPGRSVVESSPDMAVVDASPGIPVVDSSAGGTFCVLEDASLVSDEASGLEPLESVDCGTPVGALVAESSLAVVPGTFVASVSVPVVVVVLDSSAVLDSSPGVAVFELSDEPSGRVLSESVVFGTLVETPVAESWPPGILVELDTVPSDKVTPGSSEP